MAVYHEETLERAARELNPLEAWRFEFESKEEAHYEYIALQRIMKRKGFCNTTAKKCLTITREGSVLIIEMGRPMQFPVPVKICR